MITKPFGNRPENIFIARVFGKTERTSDKILKKNILIIFIDKYNTEIHLVEMHWFERRYCKFSLFHEITIRK